MDSKIDSKTFRVVMLPWLAYSHISRFLVFAKRLTNHNFHIYICSSQTNMQYLKNNLTSQYSKSIQLIELNLPSSSELPLQYHTTHGLPPHLTKTLSDDYQKSGPDFETILIKLNPHLVIYDFNQLWAPEVASTLHIPSIQLLSGCVALYALDAHLYTKPLDENLAKFPFPEIYPKNRDIPKGGSKYIERFVDCMRRSCEIILVRSTMELEGKYIDYLSKTLGKKVLPVGPLVQEASLLQDDHIWIMKWLDKKEESSVVFVCFGSEYILSDNEIEDIAYGLELSQVSFVWAIRAKTSALNGFIDRVGDKGLVIDKWVPQANILSHSSTGGFISHCGWSSTMESIRYGVPIIAMPMQFDQPYNARLMETVGAGIEVGRDGEGRLKREEIAAVVRKVVVEDSGESIREKAKELGEIMKKNMEAEVDGIVIENLVKLCEMNN
uniref:Cyanidin-3-O-glucoside 2-O-glucuronosyltransferase n=1 Tax=Bellis perennis TaxID=41492 RepID=UGAT_BELPE|nr:RecName: Full=Cyanidin-3-O-glucoside 2-O-glucuronosyltransferase; Short=BpUGAT; AltName: Full=UDP-glucuronic acid:anthocyanin glucuronosyltransferase [Bellis perennis]BAD77944.1 UDP-glucuronic acid:anthocyanin glucuronosyltransferase [Bellis perennis]